MLLSSARLGSAPPPPKRGRSLPARHPPRDVVAGVASRRRRPSFKQQDQDEARRGALEETYRRSGSNKASLEAAAAALEQGADDAADKSLLPNLWPRLAARYGDALVALEDLRAVVAEDAGGGDENDGSPRNRKVGLSLTYAQLEREIDAFARGLSALGLERGERAALFADGSPRWLVADQAVMRLGCADAVRGASSPPEELAFIAAHSRSAGLIFQDAAAFLRAAPELAVARRAGKLRAPKFVVLLWGGGSATAKDKDKEALRAAAAALGLPSASGLITYRELLASADDPPPPHDHHPAPQISISPSDLATIVYTSGTTGAQPKGCPLTHGNLRYQLLALPPRIGVMPGDASLALLPPWHVYARVAQYLVLASGGKEVYSSARHLREDLAAVRPAFLVAVPLLLEALHARAAARVAAQTPWLRAAAARLLVSASEAFVAARRRARGLNVADLVQSLNGGGGGGGGSASSLLQILLRRAAAAFVAAVLLPLHALARLVVWPKVREGLGVTKAVVSGGASLPPHLDDFFEAAGIELTSGYGLTECSPVLACRSVGGGGGGGGSESAGASGAEPNVRGTVGRPLPGTEIRVVDPETLLQLPEGTRGLVLARGPGVFKSYLDDPQATAAAFPRLPEIGGGEGWFNTGDLGLVLPASAGRAVAGSLVLSGRAKDTIVLLSGENVEPEPIEGALVVSPLVKHAIVVGQDRRELGALVFPSEEAERAASSSSSSSAAAALEREIAAEAARLNASRPGYAPHEHLARVVVAWGAALSPDDGTLTRTFKVRRAAALERHGEAYARLLRQLRG